MTRPFSPSWKCVALVAIAAVLVGWFVRDAGFADKRAQETSLNQIRVNLPQYAYINPLLFSETQKDTSPWFNGLHNELAASVERATKSGDARDVSIYFRNLNTGKWTGIRENETYDPSSMLKVVVMMGVLEIAQKDPQFLSRQIPYTSSSHSDQFYKPAHVLPSGNQSVQRLVNAMIIDSDNDALKALIADPQVKAQYDAIYEIFRLPPASSANVKYMSPSLYSVVFRTLYNSTLFPWDLSEQILDLLSRTSFTSGLVAGVPDSVHVSHKFGENTALQEDGTVIQRELHDCGIVYYPSNPYLLCIMTRGMDFSKLEKTISGISRLAYGYVDTHEAQ